MAIVKNKKTNEKNYAYLVVILPTAFTLVALVSLAFRALTWLDVTLFVVFYLLTTLGITLGYHRLLTHSSYRCTRALKNFLSAAGAMAIQGPAIWWVAHHRKHHIFSDSAHDVHTPHTHFEKTSASLRIPTAPSLKSFLHSHVFWMLDGHKTSVHKYAGALMRDQDLLKIDRLYVLWVTISVFGPAVLAALVTFSVSLMHAIAKAPLSQEFSAQLLGVYLFQAISNDLGQIASAAFGGLMWGGFVRIFAVHHATWAVNSVCHVFGRRPFVTTDLSRNNFIVAMLTNGEGWHNGHHAFPSSARHGLLPFEFDLSYALLRLFEKVGLAWDLKLPSAREIEEKLLPGVRGPGVLKEIVPLD